MLKKKEEKIPNYVINIGSISETYKKTGGYLCIITSIGKITCEKSVNMYKIARI